MPKCECSWKAEIIVKKRSSKDNFGICEPEFFCGIV